MDNLATVDIKGKQYVMVHERIRAFRAEHPGFGLVSEILNMADGVVTVKASVINADGAVVATGHAQEKEQSSYINKTSYIENCETSAFGRALGAFGIGIDTSFATADEVANAIHQQAQPAKPKDYFCETCGVKIDGMQTKSGKAMTAKMVAEGTKVKYGKALCGDCAEAEREQAEVFAMADKNASEEKNEQA